MALFCVLFSSQTTRAVPNIVLKRVGYLAPHGGKPYVLLMYVNEPFISKKHGEKTVLYYETHKRFNPVIPKTWLLLKLKTPIH